MLAQPGPEEGLKVWCSKAEDTVTDGHLGCSQQLHFLFLFGPFHFSLILVKVGSVLLLLLCFVRGIHRN